MTTGDIVIVSFPYTDLVTFKARPAVVVTRVQDNFNDVIICLITSVITSPQGKYEILLQPDSSNNLKVLSMLKVARIATVEETKVRATIGSLNKRQLHDFTLIFKSLVE